MFTVSRTHEGRHRSTCEACGVSHASWSSRNLWRWQRTHLCPPRLVPSLS